MKKTIRLTESDLVKLIKKVISEQPLGQKTPKDDELGFLVWKIHRNSPNEFNDLLNTFDDKTKKTINYLINKIIELGPESPITTDQPTVINLGSYVNKNRNEDLKNKFIDLNNQLKYGAR